MLFEVSLYNTMLILRLEYRIFVVVYGRLVLQILGYI
jgi:hypothetical protein